MFVAFRTGYIEVENNIGLQTDIEVNYSAREAYVLARKLENDGWFLDKDKLHITLWNPKTACKAKHTNGKIHYKWGPNAEGEYEEAERESNVPLWAKKKKKEDQEVIQIDMNEPYKSESESGHDSIVFSTPTEW